MRRSRKPLSDAGPPAHLVRVSPRARRARITVTPAHGVVVVVPRRYDRRQVPELLRRHADWVERALARTAEQRARLASAADEPLPERVDMPGIGLTFRIEYVETTAQGVRVTAQGDRVRLTGRVTDVAACRAALRRWLGRVASEHLPDLLDAISHDEGLAYRGVMVRAQRSRWGSCTRSGSVSLNRQLVFLPPEQVRYVMVHELLHVVRHDHSPEFWRLLAERVPDAALHRKVLKEAWRTIPLWATQPPSR